MVYRQNITLQAILKLTFRFNLLHHKSKTKNVWYLVSKVFILQPLGTINKCLKKLFKLPVFFNDVLDRSSTDSEF